MAEDIRALLLLPSGHRACDCDHVVASPPPRTLDIHLPTHSLHYGLVHLHHGGAVDAETRALYVLGGRYRPHGTLRRRLPDEAHDQ
jgi:hypothetical protein